MGHFRSILTGLACTFLTVTVALAQPSYPSRQITLIAPYGAGGAVDIVARVVAESLRKELGRPVVVDNRSGGNGLIGMRAAAKAAPDGYTLIASSESNHLVLPLIDSSFDMDVAKEFVPLSLSAQFQHALIVRREMPVESIQDLTTYIKARLGKLSFGSSGVGTAAQIAGELLNKETGAGLVHVPYRGSSAALTDLLGGSLDLNFQSVPALRPYFNDPRLSILATLSAKRLEDLPNVPTMAESGFPNFVLSSWIGIFGPAGLPKEVQTKLSTALAKLSSDAELQARIRGAGLDPVGSDAPTFAAFVNAEAPRIKGFIDGTGIKISP